MSIDISSAAATAEGIIEQVMKIEPAIATAASIFGGPAVAGIITAIQPEVLALAPFVEQALKQVAAGNGGNAIDAVAQLVKHLMPGMPNAPALAPSAPAPAATSAPLDFHAPKS